MKPTITLLLLAVFAIGLYGQTEVWWDSIKGETTIITRIPPVTELPYESKRIPDTYELLSVPDTIKVYLSFIPKKSIQFKRKILLPNNKHFILAFTQEKFYGQEETIIVIESKTGVETESYFGVGCQTDKKTTSSQWSINSNTELVRFTSHCNDGKYPYKRKRKDIVYKYIDQGFFLEDKIYTYEEKEYNPDWFDDLRNNIWDGNEKLKKEQKVSESIKRYFIKTYKEVNKFIMKRYKKKEYPIWPHPHDPDEVMIR